ncbi:hypothetical protein T03_2492 [Trichinella britovi]|uniref:Uncharacterized protein n=1 Tax=Trichinella britovi TaxID=45882 RepID=A0A0V1ANT4_TRIBR|nr:hypothetical protein T03_2492 [Trichinella britovi]
MYSQTVEEYFLLESLLYFVVAYKITVLPVPHFLK